MKVVNRWFFLNVSLFLLLISNLFPVASHAQSKKSTGEVYVDKNGIMRFKGTNEELHGFGVNYTMPFAYAYRNAKKMGVDIKKAIDNDVYHFARLGFDAFRVHVWDTEISDTVGNLLDNEHLELFDYMLWKMKERGIRFLITPIAYWGNGWPERDEKTPGFSYKYGKDASLTNPDAIKAQQNYLFQFLNHVNRYTNIAYKNDTSVIAFEISNEPHHGEAPEKVTSFVKGMISSMRNTGCTKPIFYNISHSIHLEDAYFNAGIDGGTFQWYPTGLGFKKELQGNFLPNVDEYKIPFADNPGFKKIAKVVYEFDAADVGRSYIYPAMARSFRTAGIQWATHFAYDPTYSAYANTEYDTHFMNLVYAPQKALSLMIAGEVFHKVPLYKSYGAYPNDTLFDVFHISYANDLAEMITDKKFIYTNNTASKIASPEKLNHIAGYGSSQVVNYDGTGAYFLDKLSDGVWRLEVMPDAIWIDDPFGRNSLKKTVAVVNWQEHHMTVVLPGLGNYFAIKGINNHNNLDIVTDTSSFLIQPGTYILSKVDANKKNATAFSHIKPDEFFAPATTLSTSKVIHQPAVTIDAASAYTVHATVVSPTTPQAVELHVWGGFRPSVIPMTKTSAYGFSATIPAGKLTEGFVKYFIAVKDKDGYTTWPQGKNIYPNDHDFYDQEGYIVNVVPPSAPIYLFDAYKDANWVSREWRRSNRIIPGDAPNTAIMQVNVDKLLRTDAENKNAERLYDYSMRFSVIDNVFGRRDDLGKKQKIVIKGSSLNNAPCPLQIAFTTKDAVTYGGIITLQPGIGEYSILVSALQPVKQVLLPRPYPGFLPYYFENNSSTAFNISDVESIQVSIGPGIAKAELDQPHGIAISSIRLE